MCLEHDIRKASSMCMSEREQ
uniref:Uncharacterized protein n=1 Tax=Arundo donax TaxID=35708 RepID=A0A0A9HSK2_ARUDO